VGKRQPFLRVTADSARATSPIVAESIAQPEAVEKAVEKATGKSEAFG
jgi:hypothetical protein